MFSNKRWIDFRQKSPLKRHFFDIWQIKTKAEIVRETKRFIGRHNTSKTVESGARFSLLHIILVNGLHYREMINDCFWPEMDGIDVDNFYFQQNGAIYRISNETIEELTATEILRFNTWWLHPLGPSDK